MISRIAGVMNARRSSLQEKEKGFTLIELLVVIVIIGILAAIAIPVYMNVQNNAKDSAVQSDLTNAKTAIVAVQTSAGSLPASNVDMSTIPNIVASGFTFTTPDMAAGKKITYTATASSFCIAAESVTGNLFYVTDLAGVAKAANAAALVTAGCVAP
jgi:prepilin-type N-terminal cleavage/methylation domain-containing protein